VNLQLETADEFGSYNTACRGPDAEAVRPLSGGRPPLKGEKLTELRRQIDHQWEVVEEHHLLPTFTFKDFAEALEFVNRLAQVAEEQGHHPVLTFTWRKVTVKPYTHKIDGLSESEFIFAAKVGALAGA